MSETKTRRVSQAFQPLSDLERPDEVRRQYLQNLVHELSSPLTPLVGYLALMQKESLGPLNELQSRCVGRMRRAAGRLQRVLDDVGALLHMESDTLRLEPQPHDLRSLVREVIAANAQEAEDENIEVLSDIPEHDVPVMGDGTRLSGALAHVLWNALKFNSAGGKVLIRVCVVDTIARVEVFDTGVGIATVDLPRVFEPFFQSDQTATRQFGGAGLGLSLVRWIMDLHRGSVALESPPAEQPGGHFFRGVRAILELPLANP